MHTNTICESHSLKRSLKRTFLNAVIGRLLLIVVAFWGSMATAIEDEQTTEEQFQNELDHWTLQAYEGDRDAQFKVGVLYSNNQFRKADYEQAVYWYKQAARQGHALSQYNLGHQYITGEGVVRSEKEAMSWWLKAANQEHPLAQFNLGRGFYLGIGVEKNHDRAQLWFRRAAQNNEPKSIEILNQLGWTKEGEFTAPTEAVADSSKTPNTQALTSSKAKSNIRPISKPVVTQKAETQTPVELTPVAESTAETKTPNTDNAAAIEKVAIYTNPNKRPVLITLLDNVDSIEIIDRSEKWTRVRSNNGFPVWVHKDFISTSDKKRIIIGNNVNARSVPLITDGSIVGKLRKGREVTVLDSKEQWYRIQSPATFNAWVKTSDLTASQNGATSGNVDSGASTSDTPVVKAAMTSGDISHTNNNEWLFSQPVDHYTLQLASFDDPVKVTEFESRDKFKNNPNLYRFSANSKDMEWTYFLYGSYTDSETAKIERTQIKQKLAWVRTFGRIQQNRCLAWKKQIPTPRALNKYCS